MKYFGVVSVHTAVPDQALPGTHVGIELSLLIPSPFLANHVKCSWAASTPQLAVMVQPQALVVMARDGPAATERYGPYAQCFEALWC
jgi:hypothetical protein